MFTILLSERLTDSLKVSSIPTIHAQVFLCFRVLILRISPQHLTSLWPTVITEIVCKTTKELNYFI